MPVKHRDLSPDEALELSLKEIREDPDIFATVVLVGTDNYLTAEQLKVVGMSMTTKARDGHPLALSFMAALYSVWDDYRNDQVQTIAEKRLGGIIEHWALQYAARQTDVWLC